MLDNFEGSYENHNKQFFIGVNQFHAVRTGPVAAVNTQDDLL